MTIKTAARPKLPPVKTVGQRLDEMIAEFGALNSEAHKLVDLHCDQMRLEMAPSAAVPFSIIKHDEFLRPAGNMVNMPKMLRILKEKKYGLGSGGDS